MNSTIPADLLELNTRFETWRANRKYLCEPIPNELWNAAADLSRRYPTSLVGRAFLHQRRRRFYAARRSEARASGPFLPFSRSFPASTQLFALAQSIMGAGVPWPEIFPIPRGSPVRKNAGCQVRGKLFS